MNPALRLERTIDGRRELRDRTLGLDARHRALLQQADGRRSLAEIKQRLSSVMDVEQVADELLRMRLLRSAAMMSGHGAAPMAKPAAAPAATDWRLRARRASQALHQLLGPDGDALAIAIERCQAPEGLDPLLASCRRAVGRIGGDAALGRFEAALRG